MSSKAKGYAKHPSKKYNLAKNVRKVARALTSGGMAKRGWNARGLKPMTQRGKALRNEGKYIDTLLEGAFHPGAPPSGALQFTSDFTNGILPVNCVREGAADYQRVGRKINMTSLFLTGRITIITGALMNTEDYVRLSVVYDAQPNGAQPAFADLFTSRDNSGAIVAANSFSQWNNDNRQRFTVLMDERLNLPPASVQAGAGTATTPYGGNSWEIKRYIRLKNLLATYNNTTGAIGDITSGALWIVAVGTAPAGAVAAGTAGWNFVGTCRMRFTDC